MRKQVITRDFGDGDELGHGGDDCPDEDEPTPEGVLIQILTAIP